MKNKSMYILVLTGQQVDTISRAVGEKQFSSNCPESKDALLSVVLQKSEQRREDSLLFKLEGVQVELLRDVFQKSLSNKLITQKEYSDFKRLYSDIFSQLQPNSYILK